MREDYRKRQSKRYGRWKGMRHRTSPSLATIVNTAANDVQKTNKAHQDISKGVLVLSHNVSQHGARRQAQHQVQLPNESEIRGRLEQQQHSRMAIVPSCWKLHPARVLCRGSSTGYRAYVPVEIRGLEVGTVGHSVQEIEKANLIVGFLETYD